ncbi:MAG: AAA family ATPase [Cutibacterium avidum]|uniref:HelD family protein n=1 Tax=Cutibacterium avidum TaxID=33010 RepID=UPI0014870C23|nr:UvrD-helicase domain-containing protein [Cutibacterium avidum]MBS5745137.1 AAA family ATPase [Propionibacterium sp.]MDK7359216.1 AAA family ATPase [Cutibacterium avidum]MDK7373088.1 AAA family ATPase [Cutibacterium avidum]MDU3219833.1 AAA family ATPase [Cutibacterium avidum]MDU3725571.1 AAA family ATPase [Cutibacterium avidum]
MKAEIAKEQAHVDRVRAQLEIDENKARMLATAGQDMYRSDRTSWVREEDGTAMFERDAFSYNAAKRLAILDAEHEGLVFGRLDLADDDEVRHIGRIGVRDADYEPLVIDWRARAAEPFYRATPSDPMGVIRRRVLRCRDDKVLGIEDDLLDSTSQADLPIVGEGALMAALSRARDTQMHSIVSTIQAEQDEAIRAPYQGVTTIMGGPGTGKTVVALHRAAFLLYSHRARLENGGVLVIGPSSVFMSYIERVLPSLGEDSVTLRSVGQVPSDILRFSSDRLDEPRTANIKGSLDMVDVLTRLIDLPMSAEPDPMRLRVTVKGEVLTLGSHALAATRHHILKRNRYNDGREAVEASLKDQLWNILPEDVSSAHDLSKEQFDDLVSSQASWRMFLNAWWPTLSATDVLARLADPAVVKAVAPDWDDETCQLVVNSIPTEVDRRGRRDWSVADMALLDELAALLGPVPPEPDAEDPVFIEGGDAEELVTLSDRLHDARQIDEDEPRDTYAHVLVDEAQDISPMQWRMIGRRGPQASWTIVGDPAQSAFPHPEQTRSALDELVGNAPSRTFTLTKNYRSPAEVFDLAAEVVVTVQPDADLPQAVRSVGVQPTVVRTDALWAEARSQLDEMLQEVDGTIGLVCPASLVDQAGDLATDPRIIPVTTMQAKGLEYDGAVVVDPERIVSETGNPTSGVRVLYVALTRPTQRLAVVGLRRPESPRNLQADQPAAADAGRAWSEALWSHETC